MCQNNVLFIRENRMKKLSKSLLAENIEARLSIDLEMNNISGASLIVKQAGETVY